MMATQFHTNDHSPVAVVYCCYVCGRVTMQVKSQATGSLESAARSLPLDELRALVSKIKNVIKGDSIETTPAPAAKLPTPRLPTFPYSDPTA